MNITKTQIDAISNEYESTFGRVNDQTLRNILRNDEVPMVKEIIEKHLGKVNVFFEKVQQVDEESSIYFIKLSKSAS